MIYAYLAIGLFFSLLFWRYLADFDDSPGQDAFFGLAIVAFWPLAVACAILGAAWALFVISISKLSAKK